MPKDWDNRKDELEKLYITEDKTLLEVQRILRERGFTASVRAYRMRFDEWGFRKYKLTNVRRNINKSQVPTPAEKGTAELIRSDNSDDDAPIIESSIELDNISLPTLVPTFQQPSVSSHNKMSISESFSNFLIPRNGSESVISVGGTMVPISPERPGQLFYIPHSTGLQLYGLLATWQTGGAWMDDLKYMLRNKSSQGMILEPPENVQLGDDLVANNYLEAVMRFVHYDDQAEVIKRILLAIQEEDHLSPKSPPWVVTWWKANHTCQWPVALDLLLNSPVDQATKDFFRKTGQILVAKRLLQHHHVVLINDLPCPDRSWESWHGSQYLRKEYVEIIEDIAGIESSEENLDPKFYMLALELISRAKETVSQKVDALQIQLQEAKEKEEKYCKVIAKYTGAKEVDFEKECNRLLSPENSPIETTTVWDGDSPRSILKGRENAILSLDPGAISLMTVLQPSRKPLRSLYSTLSLDELLQRSGEFETLLREWVLWREAGYSQTSEFRHNITTTSQQFVATDFQALVQWTERYVQSANQLPFLRSVVKAYLYRNKHAPGIEPEIYADGILQWDMVKRLLLEKSDYSTRYPARWSVLEYPETMLRLFGEECLTTGSWSKDVLQNCLLNPTSFVFQRPGRISIYFYSTLEKAIVNDFREWDIAKGYYSLNAT